MAWIDQFEIIKEKLTKKLAETGKPFSHSNAEQFLGVSKNKWSAWKKGQRPNADDLELIARKLDISPVWLLLGDTSGHETLHERDISIAETANGKIVGDLLWELFQCHRIDMEEAAAAMGITFEELDSCFGRAPAPSWRMLQKLAAFGININFLLLGNGLDFLPRTEIERAMLAVGASNTWEMASKLGVPTKEIDHHLALAKKEDRVMPREWHDTLHEKFGLNPGWTMSGKFPSHLERPAPQPKSTGYGTQLSAREARLHEPSADYPEGNACGIDRKEGKDTVISMTTPMGNRIPTQTTKSKG